MWKYKALGSNLHGHYCQPLLLQTAGSESGLCARDRDYPARGCVPALHLSTRHIQHPSLCRREPRVGTMSPGRCHAPFAAQIARCVTLPCRATPVAPCLPHPGAAGWLWAKPSPHTHLVSLLRPHQRDSVVLAPQQRPQRIQPALRGHSGLGQGTAAHPSRMGAAWGHPGCHNGAPLPWSQASRAKPGLHRLQPLWCCSCPPGVPVKALSCLGSRAG